MKKLFAFTLLVLVFKWGTAQENLFLDISTDCWPEENTWVLQSNNGDTLFTGGPYVSAITTDISESFWLETGNYIFTFYDAAGDGLFGTQWAPGCDVNGTILLQDAAGVALLEYDGTSNFDSLQVAFSFDETVDVFEREQLTSIAVYPNPFTEIINLQIDLNNSLSVRVTVLSMDGRTVFSKVLGQQGAGRMDSQIDLSGLRRGAYLLHLSIDSQEIVQRIVKTNL